MILSSGDVLYSIYFIREGQMEVSKNNELQAILGRNDIFGENPCNTMTPGKSRCVVKGIFKTNFIKDFVFVL
jgi:potassium voltage-gated channel Eag-related subfamily H protein 2